MKKMLTKIIVQLLFISLVGFSISAEASLTSEQKKFDKLQKKWLFKAYRKISTESIRGITQAVNFSTQDENKLERAEVHAILGFMWSLGLDADFAIADSKLALRKSSTLKDKYIAEKALTLAMYNKGWVELASEKSNKIKSNPEFDGFAEKYDKEQLIANLIVGSIAVREGNLRVVENTFAKVSKETDKAWIPTLAKTATLILNGSILDAPGHLKVLLEDPTLTAYERSKIAEISTLATNEITEKSKQNKFSQLVNGLMFESLKDSSGSAYKDVVEQLGDYISGIDF
jgi:hypothetical protein